MNTLVKMFSLTLLAAMLSLPLTAVEIDGKWKIVSGELKTPNEKKAGHFLQSFMTKILNKKIESINEKNFDGKSPAIYFGNTAYARKHGFEQNRMHDELWVLKAMPDGNMIISGGNVRGILYAVYEFVEMAGGRFFTKQVRILPKLEKITVPDDLNVSKKPFFTFRSIYTATSQYDLYSWHKLNPSVNDMGFRIHGKSHSFCDYTKDFPENEELYALQENGRRVLARNHHSYGQVCLTHPEVRRLFKEKLRKNIAQEKINAAQKKQPPAEYYRITPNDNRGYCCCVNCKKAIEKYGELSGLLIEFINDIAKDFPEINIITFAYNETLVPPKEGSIKCLPNVCIEIAQLAPDKRELMIPLSGKGNEEAKKRISTWSKFTSCIYVWDYFKVFTQPHPSPYISLIAICENIPFYAKNNVKWLFAESEYLGKLKRNDSHAFHDLSNYMAMKLMSDPFLDQNAIIKDFMEKYYGPAAEDMSAYLNYIIKRQKAGLPPATYHRSFVDSPHFDREFFATAQKHIANAAAKTAGTEYYDRVIYERVIVDSAQLYMYDKLLKQPGGTELVSREEIAGRIYSDADKAVSRWTDKKGEVYRLHQLCDRKKLNIPEELTGKKIKFLETAGVKIKDDPDSPNGTTAYLDKILSAKEEKIIFGVYDFDKGERLCKDMVIFRKDFPQDEKYHFYKVGTIKPRKKCYVFGHKSWMMNYFFFNRVEEEDLDKNYDIWVSLKLAGPAYVKGSKSVDSFNVNQVLMVESEK